MNEYFPKCTLCIWYQSFYYRNGLNAKILRYIWKSTFIASANALFMGESKMENSNGFGKLNFRFKCAFNLFIA